MTIRLTNSFPFQTSFLRPFVHRTKIAKFKQYNTLNLPPNFNPTSSTSSLRLSLKFEFRSFSIFNNRKSDYRARLKHQASKNRQELAETDARATDAALNLPAAASESMKQTIYRCIMMPKKHMVGNAPEWGKDRRIPYDAQLLGIITVLPILIGGVLVHLIPVLPGSKMGDMMGFGSSDLSVQSESDSESVTELLNSLNMNSKSQIDSSESVLVTDLNSDSENSTVTKSTVTNFDPYSTFATLNNNTNSNRSSCLSANQNLNSLKTSPSKSSKFPEYYDRGLAAAEARQRDVMTATIYFSAMLLAFHGAIHWGIQLTEFGLPRYAETQSLYYFSRFGIPLIPLSLAWMAINFSRLGARECHQWLTTGYIGMLGTDWVYHQLCLVPSWYIKFRFYQTIGILSSLFLLVFAESMEGGSNRPQIRM